MMMNELQKRIIAEMKVRPVIDARTEIRRSVDFLKEYLKKHPFIESLILGISGGQDSTLTGKLAQMAVDELNEEAGETKYSFIAVRLPYGVQRDEEDCQDAIRFINPSKVITVNIKDSVDASVAAVEKGTGMKLSDYLKGNVKARHRMEVQYSIAGMFRGVVLGTDHSAEAITGFFTKWGDGGADLVPIFRLNKRQGKMLLKELGCPEHLYLKTPTADLEEERPQLPDEVALGVTYEEIDDYLEGKEVKEESRKKIEEWFMKSEHKRRPPINVFDDWWK
jgi:NAD+ synthase